MRCERGQATIEWVGLVLLASLVLAALGTALAPGGGARSFGPDLAGRILCAMKGEGCSGGGDSRRSTRAGPDTRLVSFDDVPGAGREPGVGSLGLSGSGLGVREGLEPLGVDGPPSPAVEPGRDGDAHRQTPPVPCERWWCDVVLRQCEIVFDDRGGEAFCKARAAAEGRPSALARFIEDRVGGCILGAVGAKAFEPFAEELLEREATRSAKNARRALERGFRRAKEEVVKGKVKPGLVGCVGGALGL